MLKFLLGSRPSRRIRQSQMVTTAQVSVLEKRELLDGETGYGSYDPYGNGGSGSSGGGGSGSGSGDGGGAGGSGSSSGGGQTSNASVSVRVHQDPGSYTYSGARTVYDAVSTTNTPTTTAPLAAPPAGSSKGIKFFTDAIFDVDVVFEGSAEANLEVTATNGDETWVWLEEVTGSRFDYSYSFPVSDSNLAKIDVRLFTSDGVNRTGQKEVGVVTATTSPRLWAENAGITEGSVSGALRPKILGPIEQFFNDARQESGQIANDLNGILPGVNWNNVIDSEINSWENFVKTNALATSDRLVEMMFSELDTELRVRYATGNLNVLAQVAAVEDIENRIRATLDEHPLAQYVTVSLPTLGRLRTIAVEEVSYYGNLEDLEQKIANRLGSISAGVHVPFERINEDNEVRQCFIGAGATYNLLNGQDAYYVNAGADVPFLSGREYAAGFRFGAQHVWGRDMFGDFHPSVIPNTGTTGFINIEYNCRKWLNFTP